MTPAKIREIVKRRFVQKGTKYTDRDSGISTLARKIGVSRITASSWLSGKHKVPGPVVCILQIMEDVDLDYADLPDINGSKRKKDAGRKS